MSYNLLIVESPEKSKTIKGFLSDYDGGRVWRIEATKGHITNLPEDEIGLMISSGENGDKYTPKWVLDPSKKDMVKRLKTLAKNANEVYIATDSDREGEKIAYDLVLHLKLKDFKRITFAEITKKAILEAMKNPRKLNEKEIEEQKARRVIDRVVGYPLTRLVKHDFKSSNSDTKPGGIGRVKSISLKILCDVENAITDFEENPPSPTKHIILDLYKKGIQFRVYSSIQFAEDMQLDFAETMRMLVIANARGDLPIVQSYKPQERSYAPPKPLTTASYQYGAFYLLRIKPKEAMRIAQDLYEAGFITYARTDSYNISTEVVQDLIKILLEAYGEQYTHTKPRVYKEKQNKSVQEAHECIRPAHFDEIYFPKNIMELWKKKNEKLATNNHLKVYELIFYRTLATQMKDCIKSTSEIVVNLGNIEFKAKANFVVFDGWEKLLEFIKKESLEDRQEDWQDKEIILPEVTIGESLSLVEMKDIEKPKRRPRRYGVGRFVFTLSKMGLIRPSTVDQIVENLERDNYIEIHDTIIHPTPVGKKVNEWAEQNNEWLVDIEAAKQFEDYLDDCKNADELIAKYHMLIEEQYEKRNLDLRLDDSPSDSMKDFAIKLAKEKGQILDDSILSNKKKLKVYIDNNKPKNISIGKCPACGNDVIKKKDLGYFCSSGKEKCDFVLWRDKIISFFDLKGRETDEEYRDNIVKSILGKRHISVEFFSVKKNKPYTAMLDIKKDDKWGWQLELKFGNERGGR